MAQTASLSSTELIVRRTADLLERLFPSPARIWNPFVEWERIAY